MPRIKRKPIVVETLEAPTPEQLAQGGYERKFVTHFDPDTGISTKTMTHISSHSPVERWIKAGRLSDSQIAAIALVRALWAKCGLKQKLTASYGERMPIGTDNEWLSMHEIQARIDLTRIEGYINPPWAFEVFENVCRFDETAGSAGASLGFNGSKGAQAATLMLVHIVADQIAKEERL